MNVAVIQGELGDVRDDWPVGVSELPKMVLAVAQKENVHLVESFADDDDARDCELGDRERTELREIVSMMLRDEPEDSSYNEPGGIDDQDTAAEPAADSAAASAYPPADPLTSPSCASDDGCRRNTRGPSAMKRPSASDVTIDDPAPRRAKAACPAGSKSSKPKGKGKAHGGSSR